MISLFTIRLLYNFETKNANKYFDNYLEHEAGYFQIHYINLFIILSLLII